MRLILCAFFIVAQLHAVVGTCGRCNNFRVNLRCVDSDESYSIKATEGLACETISGRIVLQCEVEGIVNTQPSNYNYKSGTKDVAVFSGVTRPAEDLANSTLVVENIASDVVYYCEATVADMNGDSHVLRSNTLIVKKIAQDASKISSPQQYSEKPMSGNSYITVLPCDVPTGWYPEPQVVWYKGGAELIPSVRVFPLQFAVGDYGRGSLIIHGYSSEEDRAEYKCNIHYVDYAEWLAARKSGADTAQSTYEKNVTLTWIIVKLGVVSASTVNVYQDGIGRFDDGTFKAWGDPLNFSALAIGGPVGNVGGTDRVTYKWTIEGSELGLQKLNTTCVDEAKNASSTKVETNKTYTVEDYVNYPSCLYWVTEDKTRTLLLTNETMALLGIRQSGPNGNTLTLLHYSYGFDQSKFLVEITYTAKTGSGGNVEVAAKTNQGNYQGINVVSGKTPASDGNTCAYNDKNLVLPQSSSFRQKWTTSQHQPLADYPLLDACLYKNAALSGFKNDVTEVYNLAKLAENSVANKCQYYQVQRRNQRADNLWSYIYQTVLVETLGDQGDKPNFSTEQFPAPAVTWTAGNVEEKTKKLTCSSSNTAKTGTLNWVELQSDCESYTLAAGTGDAESCGYSTSLTFDMTTLSKNCTASCMSKSQCSETVVQNTTVQPSKYLGVGKLCNSGWEVAYMNCVNKLLFCGI
ncbi:hypothetical protein ACHWQZ_G014662 [Mnemiopsis leidyi]